MADTLVSVVIPAYGQAAFLGEAISSVLQQSHGALELLVVDDASPDATSAVIAAFDDPRLRPLRHDVNRGLPAARNTGLSHARGDLVAFLDADDLFHPDKLAAHVRLFAAEPSAGAAYNNRVDLHFSSVAARQLHRPPPEVGLTELVRGFPFAPSDLVVRRSWVERVGSFDESLGDGPEDLAFNCRLALERCRFVRVDRALNRRRYHARRWCRSPRGYVDNARRILGAVVSDPRCPPAMHDLRGEALAELALVMAFHAAMSGRGELATALLAESAEAHPEAFRGSPPAAVRRLVYLATADHSLDHAAALEGVWAALPPELEGLRHQHRWAVAYGQVLRGLQELIHRDEQRGTEWLAAVAPGWVLPEQLLGWTSHQLLAVRHELGSQAAEEALDRVGPPLGRLGGWQSRRAIIGAYRFGAALEDRAAGRPLRSRLEVTRALLADPRYLRNRGFWSLLLRPLRPSASGRAA